MDNITSIIHWKEPEELRRFDLPIICVTNYGRVLVLRRNDFGNDDVVNYDTWTRYRAKQYKIKYWAFLSEVVPDDCPTYFE